MDSPTLNKTSLTAAPLAPIQGNMLARGLTRTHLCAKVMLLGSQAFLYHSASLISVAIRTPLANKTSSTLGWNAFKNHFSLMIKALKLELTAPITALSARSSTQTYLKLQLALFPDSSSMKNHLKTDVHLILRKASAKGDIKLLMQAIASGADVNSTDDRGRTALHLALDGNHKEAVNKLFLLGADINVVDKRGWTPLHCAVQQENVEAIDRLVSKKTINRLSTRRKTPLHLAATLGNAEMIRKLVAAGARTTFHDNKGFSPLHLAVMHGNKDAVAELITSGASVNTKAGCDWTPLHTAANRNFPGIVEMLLSSGAKTEKRELHGRTPLHIAAMSGAPDAVAKLISSGANVNAKDDSGHTPLSFAKDNPTKELLMQSTSKGWFSWFS